jgi:hypothetical protein
MVRKAKAYRTDKNTEAQAKFIPSILKETKLVFVILFDSKTKLRLKRELCIVLPPQFIHSIFKLV